MNFSHIDMYMAYLQFLIDRFDRIRDITDIWFILYPSQDFAKL